MKMLNVIGVVVLLIGLGAAVILYGQDRAVNTDSNGDWKDSTLSLTESKANTRNIELYGGKLQVLMVKCVEWLGQPKSRAIIIGTASVLMALACFLAARRRRACSP